MTSRDDLPTLIRRRAGWRLDPAGGATYRPRGSHRTGQVGPKAAPAPSDRRTWHAAIRDDHNRVVLTISTYGPIEAVEWVERHL